MKDINRIIPISGAGGGKSGGGAATEDPNTLRSKQYAELLDVISVGPCEGLVDDAKSIFLDGIPIQDDASGEYNYDGVAWQSRNGFPDQPPVDGFPAVESTEVVNIEITSEISPIRTISDTNASAARITLRIPRLTKQDQDDGDIHGYSVSHAIDVRPDGGVWTTPLTDTIKGKLTSPYQKAYRIALPGEGPWQIRVRRTSPDSTGSNIADQAWWDNVTTIIDQKMIYPDTAYVALRASADQFGGKIPKRSFMYRGIIVDIPTNYDPYTREYSGDWDGTFTKGWTNNPAWIFYALAKNSDWGAGIGSVDKWMLYTIGKYCDELVPDGYGGEEPRYTINTVLTEKADVHKVLTSIASVFRGMVYYGTSNDTGSVLAVADSPKDVRATFGPANIIDGGIEYQDSSQRTRHNRIKVEYNDPEKKYDKGIEVVDDNETLRFGVKEKSITAFGCTSRGQARRLGLWALYTEKYETETVSFAVGNHYADIRPGDIIALNDPVLQGVRLFGRLKQTGLDTLVLDAIPPWEEGTNWKITVTLPNGENETKVIDNYDGTIVNLESSLFATPVDGATYILSADELEPRLYRVLANDEQSGHTFAITALEYWPEKFASVDYGVKFEPTFKDLLPVGSIQPPLSINIETNKQLDGGVNRQVLTVGWTPSTDDRVVGYYVSHQGPEDFSFNDAIYTTGFTHTFKNVKEGEHTVRVVAVGTDGYKSIPAQQSTTITNLLAPYNISSVESEIGDFSIRLTPIANGIQQYEFWRSNSPLQTADITSNAINLGTTSVLVDTGLTSETTYYYYIRATNAYGFSDWYPVNYTTTLNPENLIYVLSGEIGQSVLNQELQDEISLISGPASLNGSVNAKLAAVEVLFQQADAAIEQQVTDLGVTVNSNTNDITGNSNAINGLDVRVTDNEDGITSLSQDLTALTSSLSDSGGTQVVTANAFDLLKTRVSDTEGDISSLSSLTTQLQSDLTTLDGEATATAGALQTLTTEVNVIDNQLSTNTSDITTLQNTVSGNTAAIQTKADITTVTDLDTDVSDILAQYTIKIDVDGYVAGMGLMNDGNTSSTIFRTDRFAIAEPGTANTVFPFIVENGNVYVSRGIFAEASVGELEVIDGSVTNQKIGQIIKSDDYVPNQSGWIINKSGNAEYNNIKVRGTVDGSLIKGSIIQGSQLIGSAFLAPTELDDGSLTYVALNSDLSWSDTVSLGSTGYTYRYFEPVNIRSADYSDTDENYRFRRHNVSGSVTVATDNQFYIRIYAYILHSNGSRTLIASSPSTANNGSYSGSYWNATYSTSTYEYCYTSCGGTTCEDRIGGATMTFNLVDYPFDGDGQIQFRFYTRTGNSATATASMTALNDY